MSGADSESRESASGSDDAQTVPTQRRGPCPCGHPDVDHLHDRVGDDGGACRRARLRGRSGLAEQLVVALRRGR